MSGSYRTALFRKRRSVTIPPTPARTWTVLALPGPTRCGRATLRGLPVVLRVIRGQVAPLKGLDFDLRGIDQCVRLGDRDLLARLNSCEPLEDIDWIGILAGRVVRVVEQRSILPNEYGVNIGLDRRG